ncbi:50S ribosomal protein L18 [bacterium]|jgi:large subunit ribosomal protein L18|nr:50S ribosomal protein L18 [bacterium]
MKPIRRKNKAGIKSKGDRLRLNVFRSRAQIYAQIIDDAKGETLASASSLKLKDGDNIKAAEEVGKMIAEAAKEKKVVNVIFDRGNRVYDGRIKALADSARKNGMVF